MGKAVPLQRRPARIRVDLAATHFSGKIRVRGRGKLPPSRRSEMAWSTPVLVEICAGLEINGYLPPET